MDHMDIVVTAINAAVMGAVGLGLWWAFRGRFEALEKRMDRLEDRVDQRMDTFQASLDGMRESFQASLDGMRSDLTAVALAVGANLRAGNA